MSEIEFSTLAELFSTFLERDSLQLLDEVEQNIVICQWRADQLFAEAEG